MFLTDKQEKTLEDLQMLRRKIELLESHRMVMPELVNDKQYYESLKAISDEVAKIECAYGIKAQRFGVNGNLKTCMETLNNIEDMLNEMQIIQYEEEQDELELDDMFEDVFDSLGFTEEEKYNALVHDAIDEVEYNGSY